MIGCATSTSAISPRVLDDGAHRRGDLAVGEPVLLVELGDVGHCDLAHREPRRELDEPVDVPRIEPTGTAPEAVLLSHHGLVRRRARNRGTSSQWSYRSGWPFGRGSRSTSMRNPADSNARTYASSG